MEIQKGHCRMVLKNGRISFGEVLNVKERHIDFLDISPSAISERIPIRDIFEIDQYDEDDIPEYE